jgi:hypothetical protein
MRVPPRIATLAADIIDHLTSAPNDGADSAAAVRAAVTYPPGFRAANERRAMRFGKVAFARALWPTIRPPDWESEKAYSADALVVPLTPNGHYYKATTPGTTGETPPTFPTTGGTVMDGTAVWTDQGLIPHKAATVMRYRGPSLD